MSDWKSFDEAWEEFYRNRDSRPSPRDKEKAREIIAHFRSELFRPLSNYIRDHANVVHVNPGFMVAKDAAPHMKPDSTYEDEGFTHRLGFTNEGSRDRGPNGAPVSGPPYCGLCSSQEHETTDCPDHPKNR